MSTRHTGPGTGGTGGRVRTICRGTSGGDWKDGVLNKNTEPWSQEGPPSDFVVPNCVTSVGVGDPYT